MHSTITSGFARTATMAFTACMALNSCIFDYPGPCPEDALVVEYDWAAVPEAEVEGMGLLLYPTGGGRYWRYDLPQPGGKAGIIDDSYNVVTFNNDTEAAVFENDGSYTTLRVTTREGQLSDGMGTYGVAVPPRGSTEPETVYRQPDMIWADTARNLTLTNTDTITMHPRPVVARYTVIVDHIENLESAADCSMSVSGLSSGYVFASASRTAERATVPGSLTKKASDTVQGVLHTFGKPEPGNENVLSVYFLIRNGEKKAFLFDVANVIDAAEDPMNVVIHVGGISLPYTAPDEGTGMDVGVDNWDIVDIELST